AVVCFGPPITVTPAETSSVVIVSPALLPMKMPMCSTPLECWFWKLGESPDRPPARSWLAHRAAGEQAQRLGEVLEQGACRRGDEHLRRHTRLQSDLRIILQAGRIQ